MHCHHQVTRLHQTQLLGLRQALSDDAVRALKGLGRDGHHAACQEQLPDGHLRGRNGQDRRLGPVLGQHQRRRARLREGHDQSSLRVHRCLNCRVADGLDRGQTSGRSRGRALHVQGLVVDEGLGLLADAAHDRDGVLGEVACCRLAGQHDAIRAVQHSVGHIAGLRTCGARGLDHGLQHLRRGDHGLALHVALADDHLLGQEDVLRRDLHAQVAAGDHDGVAGIDDLVDVLQALLVLDLRDDLDVAAARTQGVADQLDVRGALHEGCGNEVHGMGDAEVHQVVNVLLLQHGQVHLHARQVAILALAQLHAVHDRGDHVV
mmetsp:Transcript_101220/g.264434  ORF Transcript_101220/g.264434 Transcript_101220/m.264434 type:complete len:320 (+) Transcript_101220:321-1280(+)